MKKFVLLLAGLFLSTVLYAQYAIYPQVSSGIVWIAEVGQNIKKGKPLVKLDARLAKAKLEEQSAVLLFKQSQLKDKALFFQQTQQLFDNLVRSKREFELAEIDYKQAQYEVQAQKSRVAQQQLQLEKHQILAPFDLQVLTISNPRNTTNHHHPKPLLSVEPVKN
jgi:multidrug resistance efflux pump